MCDVSIVLPSGSLTIVSFEIMTGTIVVASCFYRCRFAPESRVFNRRIWWDPHTIY